MNFILWILAFFFGYTIKKEGENLNLFKTDVGMNGVEDEKKISDKIKYLNDQLTDIVQVNIKQFGASTSNVDNHDAILNALNYCQSKGGGVVLIPIGEYKTSPIVLNNHKNIIIRGVSPSLPWNTTSCLKIISPGSVGLQLSEESGLGYPNEVPTWNAKEIILENIRIDGNKMVDTCLNGNYGITLINVTTERAKKDGIVMEPQTYPFVMYNVHSRYNGRHGLLVKAPYTTVYNIYKSEFHENDGYGIVIEDGSHSMLQDILLQKNKQGGLKINKKDPALYSNPPFLGNLLFVNLYTEGNGTLLETDSNFEGNCAVKTLSYNKTPKVNAGKIQGLTLINCIANASKSNGFSSKAWALSGLYDLSLVNTVIPESSIDYSECGMMGVNSTLSFDNKEFTDSNTTVKSIPLINDSKSVRAMVGHGYIGMRGRMRELHFHLPGSSIVAGKSTMLNIIHPTDNINFYPLLQNGSFYGINIYQRVKPATGSLTFKIKYGDKAFSTLKQSYISSLPRLKLDSTKNNISLTFPLLKHMLSGDFIIGVEVTASADYTTTRIDQNYSDIICELFIES